MSGQLSKKIMSKEDFITITRPTRKFFENKWFVREDFRPEPFFNPSNGNLSFSLIQALNLYESGNCFNSRQETFEKCNLIRSLLGVPMLTHKNIEV